MKKWIKILLIIAGLGIAAGIMGYIFVYNKSHPDFENLSSDYALKASELFTEFKVDAIKAQAKYNGKMVQINGQLMNKELNDTMAIAVFVFEQGMFGDEGIRCTMLPTAVDNLKVTESGAEVVIKGYLTGYNEVDIIMEKCSMLKSE
ncbi:MAG: hypothetical protein Q7J34_06150 [Bacteroidales bacterium]|jgi:hypothetical protein|nr:hypothetical protein [Bacteroidales bacterium]